MTEQQRRAHMHKVSSTAISTGTVATSGSLPPPSSSVDSTQLTTDTGTVADLPPSSSLDYSIQLATVTSLSVEISSIANDVLVHLHCLQGIWKKAEELLATPGSITAAPGSSEEARMVLSRSWLSHAKAGSLNVILIVPITNRRVYVLIPLLLLK